MESICAIIFTIILMLPLLVQLQMLIVDPKKLCTIFHYYATTLPDDSTKRSSPEMLQFYPKLPPPCLPDSNSKITIANLRASSSLPALPPILSIDEKDRSIVDLALKPTGRSSPFVKTDEALPVVDITWNYNSYRYKIFEASLRNHYGNDYPPGNVVLNSMQLNLPDSRTMVYRDVSCGLFDFVKESDVALNGSVARKLEIEYLNPLDHFVTRQRDKPSTEERFTETLREEKEEETEEDREGSPDNGKRTEVDIGSAIGTRGKSARSDRRSAKEIGCVQSAGNPNRARRRDSLSSPRRNCKSNNFEPERKFTPAPTSLYSKFRA